MSRDDVRREPLLPARVVQALREDVRGVLGEEEALDRGAPEERLVALPQPWRMSSGYPGSVARPVCSKLSIAVLQAEADLVLAVGVGDDRLAPLVRRLDDRLDLLLGHLVLVDQLDDVHARVHELLDLRARVGGAGDAPAELLLVLAVRLVLDERPGDEEPRPGDLSLLDPPLDVRMSSSGAPSSRANVTPLVEQLPRRRRHDLVAEARPVRLVPVLVVPVAEDHQVDVHVREARQHGHAARVDRRNSGRHATGPRAHGAMRSPATRMTPSSIGRPS